jgi:hypothetical protein
VAPQLFDFWEYPQPEIAGNNACSGARPDFT